MSNPITITRFYELLDKSDNNYIDLYRKYEATWHKSKCFHVAKIEGEFRMSYFLYSATDKCDRKNSPFCLFFETAPVSALDYIQYSTTQTYRELYQVLVNTYSDALKNCFPNEVNK